MRYLAQTAGAIGLLVLTGFGPANAAQTANMSLMPNASDAGVQLVADGCGPRARKVCVDWHKFPPRCLSDEYRRTHVARCCERLACVPFDRR